ncbi:MAG: Phosphomannomutase [Devosia sp.]|uniref:phosphomannomutase n=1 Tax=Devosia sp. TaxID=1871048 RepID=UPI002604FAA7|nr:phosphomannomutase [Devosia sp.]MDB5586533.1 Phosphomannomutase [Devosia sp.]
MDSLKFGTSGLRGLAVDLQGQSARRYTAAFLRHLDGLGAIVSDSVYLARDFRASSAAVTADCAAAIEAHGLRAVDCGALPTPALALHAMAAHSPSIMITGSHIPADRNGLKFYTPSGEIGKADEAGILAALRDEAIADGALPVGHEHVAAIERYVARFANLVPAGALRGWRIGLFEHSTVARDILGAILHRAGAEIVPLGRVDGFVAVDTEAFGDAVFGPLKGWIASERLDAIVSADGDGDRPLLMDGQGAFVRGDVLGLLAARYLGADAVVTPVTSNSAIEKTGFFPSVIRTKVGSPYVIAGIAEAIAGGSSVVVGFEANGGTLLGTSASVGGGEISALPTRDAVLPLLSALGLAARQGLGLAELVAGLPLQYAASDRLEHVPGEKSAALLGRLAADVEYAAAFFAPDHEIERLSQIDGLQFWTRAGEMVHFRASGNAPELRCYVESGSEASARALLQWGLAAAVGALKALP